MNRPIRVLVADDEPLISAGIRTVLESAVDVEVIAQAANGAQAVELAEAHRVDVALLDITMPGLDGLAVAERLARLVPAPRVVLLTAFGDQANVVRALHHGVAGFVLKNCAPDELVRAVRAAHAGEAYLSPAVARLVMDLVPPERARRQQRAARRLAVLTERETEVLHLVAEGLANAEIGQRLHMSETTIKTYVSRILSKLDCSNRVQAALLARDAELGPGR